MRQMDVKKNIDCVFRKLSVPYQSHIGFSCSTGAEYELGTGLSGIAGGGLVAGGVK